MPDLPRACYPRRTPHQRTSTRPAPSAATRKHQKYPPFAASTAEPWISATLLFLVIGAPLAILPARFATYDTTPKLAIFYLGSALLLWQAGRWRSCFAHLWRTHAGRAFYALLIAGTASLVISSVLSNDPQLSFAGTFWRRLGAVHQAIIFFVGAVIAAHVYERPNARARQLMWGMEAAGAIASVYAILQYAGWDPLIPHKLYTLGTAAIVRPPATLTQATYFATFLLGPILAAVWFRLQDTRPRLKRAHELVLFLTVAALILSGTRSALLGLAVGLGALIYAERERFADRRILARAAVTAFAFVAILTVFVSLPVGKSVRARMTQWGGAADRSGGPRLLVWRDSLPLVWQHPVFGIGPEMFEAEFRKTESLELARAFPDNYHESAHNFFLEIAISQGIPGVALWLFSFGLAWWCSVIALRRAHSEAGPAFAALIAMLISLQFCPLTLTNELYLIVITAVLVGLAAQPIPSESPMRLSTSTDVLAKVIAAGLLLTGGFYIAQATLYTVAEIRLSHRDVPEAANAYKLACKFPIPGPNLALSQYFAMLARQSSPLVREQALSAAKQAAEVAERGSGERSDALYQLAMLSSISGDLPGSERDLRAAINAAPVWYRPRMALARLLWLEGRNREAERETALALGCAGSVDAKVRRTLDEARGQAGALRHPLP